MKVGSRVKLLGFVSKKYDKYNPKDIEGTIVNMTAKYNPVEVLWDNGIKNSYQLRNLDLV